LAAGQWSHGWRSHNGAQTQPFWNRHFAGATDPAQLDVGPGACDELARAAPLVHACWRRLSQTYLTQHALQSCYANGLPYGADGALHADSLAMGACTAVYYPHERWDPDWGGETVLFNKDRTDILCAVYPKPNRLLIFPGFVYHVARGVSRACPTMRITLMFKTQWRP
ncbi:prolyl 4-hydroxylase BcaB, partial [Burkholderia pseudomallei]